MAQMPAAIGADNLDSKTIRIEPRAFYGATISLEAGVRVFRPLPPTKHMIINPDKTPLHLSLTEATHNINNNTVNGGGLASGGGSGSAGGYIPFQPKFGRKFRRGGGHGGKGRGGHGRVGRF